MAGMGRLSCNWWPVVIGTDLVLTPGQCDSPRSRLLCSNSLKDVAHNCSHRPESLHA